MSAKATVGSCEKCGKQELISPLHGDRGGPSFCIRCGMDWHGEHGRRRNAGRIVIKAMKAYFEAGGQFNDIQKLKLAATGSFGDYDMRAITLGYDADNTGATIPDLTTELLKNVLALVHPDHQPPERRELAIRVTQELNSLKPYVFPAPKPAQPLVSTPEPRDGFFKGSSGTCKKPSQVYPCEDCADHIPKYYCTACKAEFDRRWMAEREHGRAKQREQYKRRKMRREWRRPELSCICGAKFKPKRADSKHCSAKCKQKAYRQRHSDHAERTEAAA